MGVASRIRRVFAVFLVSLPLWGGCAEPVETAPAVEPNSGPGGPPGGGTSELKAPTFTPGGKADKPAEAKK